MNAALLHLSRLHRPIGIILLLIPCWWGVALADPYNGKLYLFMTIGAIFMRTAGCILNDYVDRNFDRQVTRTKNRPLAAGTVTMRQASVLFIACCLGGLIVLRQLPPSSQAACLLGLILLILYPFTKRVTYWPQLVLGLTFSIGVWASWLAVIPAFSSVPLCFYVAAVCWVIAYDTIYAYQDRQDDKKVGIKSLAVWADDNPYPLLCTLYGVMIGFLILGGWLAHLSYVYWLSLLGASIFSIHILRQLDINDASRCLQLFKQNAGLGMIIFLGILGSQL